MEKTSMEISHNLNRISILQRIASQKASAKAGIYIGQLPLLGYVAHHPGCTQRDVAAHLQVSAPNITAMVKRMVRAGLMEKQVGAENLRCNSLFITPQGKEMLKRSVEVFTEIDRMLFAGFSEQELLQLHAFTTRVFENGAIKEYRESSNFVLFDMLKKMENDSDAQLPYLSQEQEVPTVD